ncbi:MAG: 16S rRNA (cytosine(967)-C(5))-methyltransferase RsmB [Burkholderiaceae bacterium]
MNDQTRLPLAQEIAYAARSVGQVLAGHTLPVEPLSGSPAGGAHAKPGLIPARSRAAIRDMAYRTVRELGLLQALLGRLNRKRPDTLVYALQLVALQQLVAPLRDAHVVVDQAVSAARLMPETRPAGGLINAVLRRYLREHDALRLDVGKNPEARWNFPRWWIDQLKREYPGQWQQLLEISDRPAPMTLRINQARTTVDAYLAELADAGLAGQQIGPLAVRLERAVDVARLPGFEQGLVSVQDAGAQLAASLLQTEPGQRVLDACAAPGGKTAHLLEQHPLRLLALDSDASRLERVGENLRRLDLIGQAELRVADASEPSQWWDNEAFDRILVDAPCTASGIVRRHPEIRWLRQRRDIETLAATQTKILAGLWPTLKPGGKLLYVTCSMFSAEGEGVTNRFLTAEPTARRVPLSGVLGPSGDAAPIAQLLPRHGEHLDHDGFFYALIEKLV